MHSTPAAPKKLYFASLVCLALAACQNITEPDSEPVPVLDPANTSQPESIQEVASPTPRPPLTRVTEEDGPERFDNLWNRIAAGMELQEHYYRDEVQNQLRNYAGRQNYFDLVTERAQPFLFSIVEEIENRGLPLELALLPMVESTFNPRARSGDNAVGLWQFLSGTGASYGLQQDFWYDGRRDPLAATPAALDFLEELYQQFNEDWLLALAAYNTGGANLQRALRRHGTSLENTSFWDLPLTRETRSHVPRLLALSRIIADPAAHGIELSPLDNENPLVKVEIGKQIELSQVAALIGEETDKIQQLNPGYLQWATHPEAPQSFMIPAVQEKHLLTGLATLDPAEFVSWEHYRIEAGDTLSGIARKINTSVALLRTVNGIQGSQIIAGRDLLIPRGLSANDSRLATLQLPAGRLPVSVPETYTIRRGDNLWTIARRLDLYSVDIAAWNGFEPDELLHPGQVLDLGFADIDDAELLAEKSQAPTDNNHYTVRRGDSPAKIAGRLGINVQDVLRWNQLTEGEIIYPGQRMRITPPQGELN